MFDEAALKAIRDAGYAVDDGADIQDLSDEMLLAMLDKAFKFRPAALLEELGRLRGVEAQAQVDAKFIHEALGWTGEWPRSLPAPSRAVVVLLERVTRLGRGRDALRAIRTYARNLSDRGDAPGRVGLEILETLARYDVSDVLDGH